jgi:hypothetical protein
VQLLRSLRDVEGVLGSFVWGKRDGLLARDLPGYLDSAILAEVGPRIERIYEAFHGAGDELDGATLSYAQYKLHLRELDPAFIVVLSGPQVNVPTLKMAMHVVGRGVCAEIERMRQPPPPAAVSVPPPVPDRLLPITAPPPALGMPADPAAAFERPSSAPQRPSRTRYYRGTKVPE